MLNYLQEYSILKPMVLFLKHLLKVNGLNDPYSGGISSYGLTLMIVAFLQNEMVVFQGMYDHFYNDKSPDHSNLSLTLRSFLEYYGKYVDFSKLTIKPCMPGEVIQNPVWYQFTDEKLLIVDPLNANNNVGKSSFNIAEIKVCFEKAFQTIKGLMLGSTADYDEWKNSVLTI